MRRIFIMAAALALGCAAFAEEAARQGYSVKAGPEAKTYHVDLETDAYIIGRKLDGKINPAVARADVVGEKVDFTQIVEPVFRKSVSRAADMAVQNLSNRAEYVALEKIDREGTDESYAAALEQYASLPDSDPLKGYANVNKAILLIKQKKYDEALALVEPVANGDVASAAPHRVMAMVRYAWLKHNHQKDRLTAYQAYREIENFSGSEAVKIRCRVEQAGLLMELAESGKGNHQDVRDYIDRVRAEMPEGYLKQRAVLDLIYMESFARQPERDLKKAIDLGIRALSMYDHKRNPELTREMGSLCFMLGNWHLYLGELDKAEEYYRLTLSDFPGEGDYFSRAHPHAEALCGLAVLARGYGNRTEELEYSIKIVDQFPDSEAAFRTLGWLGNISGELEEKN